jgi:hypothetical protein
MDEAPCTCSADIFQGINPITSLFWTVDRFDDPVSNAKNPACHERAARELTSSILAAEGEINVAVIGYCGCSGSKNYFFTLFDMVVAIQGGEKTEADLYYLLRRIEDGDERNALVASLQGMLANVASVKDLGSVSTMPEGDDTKIHSTIVSSTAAMFAIVSSALLTKKTVRVHCQNFNQFCNRVSSSDFEGCLPNVNEILAKENMKSMVEKTFPSGSEIKVLTMDDIAQGVCEELFGSGNVSRMPHLGYVAGLSKSKTSESLEPRMLIKLAEILETAIGTPPAALYRNMCTMWGVSTFSKKGATFTGLTSAQRDALGDMETKDLLLFYTKEVGTFSWFNPWWKPKEACEALGAEWSIKVARKLVEELKKNAPSWARALVGSAWSPIEACRALGEEWSIKVARKLVEELKKNAPSWARTLLGNSNGGKLQQTEAAARSRTKLVSHDITERGGPSPCMTATRSSGGQGGTSSSPDPADATSPCLVIFRSLTHVYKHDHPPFFSDAP